MRVLLFAMLLLATLIGPQAGVAAARSPAGHQSLVSGESAPRAVLVPSIEAMPSHVDAQRHIAQSFAVLIELFVLAVVLESALALIFSWRPFRMTFVGGGTKPVVAFVGALVMTCVFHTEIIARIVEAFGGRYDHGSEFFGRVIDAMIIAGGSTGAHSVLQKLGFRLPTTRQSAPPMRQPSEGRLAVSLMRQHAVGAVQLAMTPAAADAGSPWQICGTIHGNRRRSLLARFFLKDGGWSPSSPGWPMPPGSAYLFKLTGFDAAARPIETAPYGPVRVAAGASVGVELIL